MTSYYSYHLKTRAGSLIEFRCEPFDNRWSIWYDHEGNGEVNEKLDVDLWIVSAPQMGLVPREDGYYDTEIARRIWNILVRHNRMVRTTLEENVR